MVMTSIVSSSKVRPTIKLRFRSVEPVETGYDPRPLLSSIQQTIVPKDYTLKDGFPTIPTMWVTSDAYISASGEAVGDPTYPWEIYYPGYYNRFLAIDTTWDDIGSRWNPFHSDGADYYFQWTGTGTPYLEDIEYRIGKRLFQMTSVRLPEGCSLDSAFNGGLDDGSSFMVAMAGLVNTTETASLIRVGDTGSTAVEATTAEDVILSNTSGSARLTTTVHPASMTPFYLVLINDSSYSEIRVATGTSHIHSAKISSQDVSRSLSVHIGRALDDDRSLDLNLFEVTVFPYAYGGDLTPNQVLKTMADVYGSA